MNVFRILSKDNFLNIHISRRILTTCAAAIAMSFPVLTHGERHNKSDLVSDSCRIAEKIYFKFSSASIDTLYRDNAERIERLRKLFAGGDILGLSGIKVIGSASPEGDRGFNMRLAHKRGEALRLLIVSFGGVQSVDTVEVDSLRPASPDEYKDLRYAELEAVCNYRDSVTTDNNAIAATEDAVVGEESSVAGHKADGNVLSECDAYNTDSVTVTMSDQTSASDYIAEGDTSGDRIIGETPARHPRFFLTTNILYDALLTPNLGIGICIGNRVTLFADWMHAWWSNREHRRYWRVYGGDFEVRYQLGGGRSTNPLSGHRVGVYASIMTYDFQFGRSHTGVIGDKYNYAAGVSYGYSVPIARRFNIDFAIGIGYMWGRYMKQHLEDDHDVWQSTHVRHWFGPTRAEIGLTWMIGAGNVNVKRAKNNLYDEKGGGK